MAVTYAGHRMTIDSHGTESLPSGGVLAGGAGTRFGGQDKGWVEWQGRPLIAWVLDALRPQAGELLISANRNIERYAALGVRVVADIQAAQHQGPLAGMVELLGAARADWLLCVPCDALWLPPDLGARFGALVADKNADIAVLADAEGIHPTFCYLRTALAGDARAAVEAGERAPRRGLERPRLVRLEAATPLNLNSPGALASVRSAP
jgi:molybdopterin-guanine dinucleotide biosynthesis protein A